MARIQIPLEAITSRLNLGDRFSGVRSQSFGQRFANLKPVSEFLDLKRLSKPANFGEVQTRVNYNLGYFSSNYAVLFVMLSIYSLLTNLLLLFVIILVVGGMWTIGKLEGRDLDIGVAKATTSQLYTGLLIVAVPLGIWASPFSTMLWLIGATGTYRECFFRGGGLGGRPRTPYDTPFWGRPPGARQGKKNTKGWSKKEQRRWEERRVEELSDTDDDDEEGVELDLGGKRFTSDELQFTGYDMGSGIRRRRGKHDSEDESEDSEDASENDMVEGAQNMQLVLRDKEEYLVQTALERIRRAQMMGKTNVKLSHEEMEALDALDRKKRLASRPQQPRSKKGSSSSSSRPQEEEKKKKKSKDKAKKDSPRLAAIEPRKSGRSSLGSRSEIQTAYPVDPYGPGGALVHGGYYAPPAIRPSSSGSRSGSRNASNQSLRQAQAQAMPQYQLPYPQGRYYTMPEAQGSRRRRPSSSSSRASSRPDPADPSWEPRARSSSTLPYPVDPPQYPPYPTQALPSHFDPRDPRFAGRRVASGPPDIYPAGLPPAGYYRYPQDELFMHSGSDPNLAGRRAGSSGSGASSTDEDDDEGVQVEVRDRPTGGYEVQTRSSASSSKAKGGGTTSKRGKGKR